MDSEEETSTLKKHKPATEARNRRKGGEDMEKWFTLLLAAVVLALGIATGFIGGYRIFFPVSDILELGWSKAWYPGAFILYFGFVEIWVGAMLVYTSRERG